MCLSKKNKQVFLDGMRRYQDRGVDILIDGESADEKAWDRIFTVCQDDSFYVTSFSEDQSTGQLKEINISRQFL